MAKANINYGLPRWLSGKEPACQCRRGRFDPWVRKSPWRRKWQPTPVFLPGESDGQRSLAGHSLWSCRELDRTSLVAQMVKASGYNVGDLGSIPGSGRYPGEGNGNPLQYSCLENRMDRGA